MPQKSRSPSTQNQPEEGFVRPTLFSDEPGFGYSSYSSAPQPNYSQALVGQQYSSFTDDYLPLNDSESQSENSAAEAEAVLCLKDETIYGLRDYWFAGGKAALRY